MEAGKGITIFHSESAALSDLRSDDNRLVDMRWDIDRAKDRRFPARVRILAKNAPGTLATIANVIAGNDGNIQNFKMEVPVKDFTEMEIDIEVRDLTHLTRITNQLGKKKVTTSVERVIG